MSEKEARGQVQPQELRALNALMSDSAEKTWDAFNADRSDSPIARPPPPREAPAQREQQPLRQLGHKYQPSQTDVQRYGEEWIEIFKRADEKKRAKTELVAAQLKFSEA